MRTVPTIAVLLLAACVPDEPVALSTGEPFEPFVTDAWAWAPAPPALDPFAEHRPLDDRCPEGSWGPEDGALEVSTGLCRYAWLEQELPEDVPAGAVLTAELWHTGLDAAEPAEAHVAVLLGERVGWEATAAIPSDPTLWEVMVVVDAPVAAGETVSLHLHNHGDNAWKLGPVTIE